ncbi:MAG TPA: type III-A CRISPR-associated protein Csm2 [Persephonella sp.]|nr:type III-A CRISPR-associated protein Csm2 [Persephonella sp.]
MVSYKEIKVFSEEVLKHRKTIDELKERIKRKDISQKEKEEISKTIKNIENKEIPKAYKKLMENLTELIDNTDLSNLDLQKFLEPNGYAEAIAVGIKFKRTQLRKFFAEVKAIQVQEKSKNEVNSLDIIKLIPKLAYSQARGLIDDNFFKFMKILLDKIRKSKSKKDYEKFVDIFEAIVAYHYYYNPKED